MPVGFDKQNCHLECKNIVFVQNFVSAEKNNVGNVFSCNGSDQAEVKIRLDKARRAWPSMGKLWSSSAPERFKVICFRALVQNALLSGLEALVLAAKEVETLEIFQMRCLRRIMCGGACFKVLRQMSDGSSYTQFKALTSTAVRKILKIPTLESELRAKRL